MTPGPARNAFYITTAIDYVNDLPHLGTAYEKVCADIIARYMRLAGRDTFFSMGNDEHSQNVLKAATQKGIPADKYCDQMAAAFQRTWAGVGISYDSFIRTTEPRHQRAVEEIFRRISAKGDIYKAKYAGWYCVSCEGFLQEEDLVDGKCPHHQSAPTWIEEENIFFSLTKYAQRLLAHIEANPDFILPETRRNEVVSFVRRGLTDVSVSRSGVSWGIGVPGDPSHVFYVWFDALTNYLAAIGFPDDAQRFARYWPADLHVIGKDITRFHCILWPAMLMSADLELPKTIFGHGFVSFRGERLSKTLGNIINPLDVVDKYGADPLRYFLAREIVFGKDGDFSWDQFIKRHNSELANDLGNLLSRATNMVRQYLGGAIPEPGERARSDGAMRSSLEKTLEAYRRAMEAFEIHVGLSEVFAVVRDANRYIEEKAPWALVKEPDGRKAAAAVLYDVCEVLRQVAVLLFPFMPAKSAAIWRALGISADIASARFGREIEWRESWQGVASKIGEAGSLFPRIELDKGAVAEGPAAGAKPAAAAATAKDREGHMTAEDTGAPAGPANLVDFAEFKKLDLRIAHIKSATAVPGATKLLKLFIDIGGEERQIVAGIAEHYTPEELAGKNIVVIANLKPARIRGVDSNGMLLAATDGGRVIVLVPDKPAAPGSKIS
jgi:methionyl-tRNA synthetase